MAGKKKSKITKEEVRHVANLAKLPLTKKEIKKFQKQLSDILDYASILEEVDTSKVEPTSQVTGLLNVFRKDKKEKSSISSKEALSNAPQTFGDYFRVKGIFDET